MAAMVRKPILMPDDLIELIETVAAGDGVSFAESARSLMRHGLSMPDAGSTNPFGVDDAMLEVLLSEAVDSVHHTTAVIDDLLMTLAARDAAEAPR
jgi:hypothetical protein